MTLFGDLRSDARESLRRLTSAPGFALVSLLTFAIGIGATTAMFSAVNEVMLRPLAVPDPDRLVMLWESNTTRGWHQVHAAPANALDWRARVQAFQDVALVNESTSDVAVPVGSIPAQMRVSNVSGNTFAVLGMRALRGRTFTEGETWADSPPRVVLSHAAWVGKFGSDERLVGRTIMLDGVGHEVIGVLAPGVKYPINDAEAFTTFRWTEARRASVWFRQAHVVRAIARLRPGSTHEQAAAQLQAVARSLESEYPATNREMRAGLTPLHRFLVGDRRQPLLLLLGAAGFLQLIVCANLANLLVARAMGRRQEMSVRKALGADGWRLARQVLTESAVLAVSGTLLGVLVGSNALDALALLRPAELPALVFYLDWRVLAFTSALTGVSALLFGLQPALASARLDIRGMLSDSPRTATGSRRSFLAQQSLVAVEVALAVMLVAGAGLMLRSLGELRRIDAGANLEGVLTFEMRAPSGTYPNDAARAAHTLRVLEALRASNGIREAGAGRLVPFAGLGWTSDFTVDPWEPNRFGTDVRHREVTPGYFRALQVPLIEGALFRESLAPGEPVPVVVNQAFVRRYFPGASVVGRRIAFDRMPDSTSYWYNIVGVVGNERMDPMVEPPPEIIAHLAGDTPGLMRFVVKSDLPMDVLMARVRTAAASVDRSVPVTNVRTMRRVAADSLAADRYLMVLLSIFAAIAVALAGIGVYGVSAQSTRSRLREIGIRVALGASTAEVTRTIIARSVLFVGLGIAAGVAGTLAARGLLARFLFRVQPTDPVTIGGVALLVFAVALSAALYPAWRTSRIAAADVLTAP
jgi:predicted permease